MAKRMHLLRRNIAFLMLAVLFCAFLHLCLCPDGNCALCPSIRALIRGLSLIAAARLILSAPSRLCHKAGAARLRRFDTLLSRKVLLRC